MDTAKKKDTKEILIAIDVQKMSQDKRDKLKGKLECEGCRVNAHFVQQGTNGRVPCFGARHIPGCPMQNSKRNTSEELKEKELVRKRKANLEIFGLKLKNYFVTSIDDESNDLIEPFEKSGSSHRSFQKEPTQIVIKQLTLPQILRYAVNGLICDLEISIKLDDKFKPISEEVVSFKDIDKIYEKQTKLFWGFINGSNNEMWLNSDKVYPFNGVSIKLGEPVKDTFWSSLGKIYGEWKLPVPVIVYGVLHFSPANKPYIEVSDFDKIYVNKKVYRKNL